MRLHAPYTGQGKERRAMPAGGLIPGGVAPSWPGKATQNSVGKLPRKTAKPVHPDCATDIRPHRELTHKWRRWGLSVASAVNLVHTTMPGDSLGLRALSIYIKMES